jgi:hypothetical protein
LDDETYFRSEVKTSVTRGKQFLVPRKSVLTLEAALPGTWGQFELWAKPGMQRGHLSGVGGRNSSRVRFEETASGFERPSSNNQVVPLQAL